MKKLLLTISILILMSVMSCGDLPETFNVIYHGDEDTTGFPPTDNNKYKSGETAIVLGQHTLLKTGFEFAGWNDNKGAHYDEGDEIEIKNISIFLFAVWEEKN